MTANQGVMRIGEVHAQLRKDFPDVELSKIRYYEDKGLVQPSRSRKGYRLYSDRDVACLREAIRLAQEEFVPLRVVRVRLIEQGLLDDDGTSSSARQAARETIANVVSIPAPSNGGASAPSARPNLSVVRDEGDPTESTSAPQLAAVQYWTLSEFLEMTGLNEHSVFQLQTLGLLVPAIVANEIVFTGVDVRVADAVSVL